MLLEVLTVAIVVVVTAAAFCAVGWPWWRPNGWHDGFSQLGWRALTLLGVAFAAGHGPYVMALSGLGGASLGLLADWLLVAARGSALGMGRPGSMLDRAERARAPFAAGVALAALGSVLAMPRLNAGADLDLPSWVGVGLFAAGAGLQFFAWARGARAVRDLLDVGAEARPLDGASVRRADRTVDVGLGDQTWFVDPQPGAPYRDGLAATLVLLGHPVASARAAIRQARRRVPVLVVSSVVFGGLCVLPPYRPPPVFDDYQVPVAKTPAAPTPFDRTYLTWYPQPRPMLADVDGDGVEDVIGLRWNGANEKAALHVVANDGKTFRELWRSEGFPAQWYGGSTFLVQGGDKLFMTDGEGNLRVFDPRSGAMVAFASVPRSKSACGLPGEAAAFLTENQWSEEGRLVDAVGRSIEARKRPKDCVSPADDRWCSASAIEPCQRAAPTSLDGAMAMFGSTWQDGELGVSIGVPVDSKPTAMTPFEPRHLYGFDPATGARRYDVPVAFDARPLHANPSLQTTFAGGRVFAYYQLKSGEWTLGARDGRTGAVIWQVGLPRAEMGANFHSMHASPTRLYVSLDHRLEVFDAATGRSLGVIW